MQEIVERPRSCRSHYQGVHCNYRPWCSLWRREPTKQCSIQDSVSKQYISRELGYLLDLLESATKADSSTSSSSSLLTGVLRQAFPYVPFFLRQPLASLSLDGEYIPMRDLFTSPAVSFAYERGWREGFAAAGFPGADVESWMAMDYFAPVVAMAGPANLVVVDMSCATGTFVSSFVRIACFKKGTHHKGI